MKGDGLRSGLSYDCYFLTATECRIGGLKDLGYGKDLSILAIEEYTLGRHLMARLG